MKIAIHESQYGFHLRWAAYCEEQGIPYKRVNCYANDLVEQLVDCNALMWHHSQSNPKDVLIAKQIIFALEHTGLVVFPDFRTTWHFDDKVGQKYLLERINAPLVPSYVFYDKQTALEWAKQTHFPKVFKLRGGAGSANVKLIKTRDQAKHIIRKAFANGFTNFNRWGTLKERWRKFKNGKGGYLDLIKGLIRLVYPPYYDKVLGKEVGYVYLQDFIPNLDHDVRIIVIADKAIGIKRYVRQNDFKASGSGILEYDKKIFPVEMLKLAFELAQELNLQSAAFDFVETNGEIKLIEVSYGFPTKGFADDCPGYWDRDLNWNSDEFNPQGWMVDIVQKQVEQRKLELGISPNQSI